jgi:hypothetical protein
LVASNTVHPWTSKEAGFSRGLNDPVRQNGTRPAEFNTLTVVNILVPLELKQRVEVFSKAIATLRQHIERWSHPWRPGSRPA